MCPHYNARLWYHDSHFRQPHNTSGHVGAELGRVRARRQADADHFAAHRIMELAGVVQQFQQLVAIVLRAALALVAPVLVERLHDGDVVVGIRSEAAQFLMRLPCEVPHAGQRADARDEIELLAAIVEVDRAGVLHAAPLSPNSNRADSAFA
jgi:hypothetical protein